jgi:branched-chain amino acid transport system substrate-binding protein
MFDLAMATRQTILGLATAIFVTGALTDPAAAQERILKIGVLGVMSGPAASWGLVNKYCAETTAQMYNEKGGVEIGGEKYKIQIVSIDDKNDPKLAVSGAERLIRQEGIRYIIGPNVDTTVASVVPLLEAAGAINVTYAFSKSLYTAPRSNSILGMIASYQVGPIIYEYLKEKKGVETVSFVARNDSESLKQRDEGVVGAKGLRLQVVSSVDAYEPGTTDFFPVMTKVLKSKPDLIVLSGVAPGDAPLILKAVRELGYKGLVSTETAQDAKLLSDVAGPAADGFISVGGASTPEIRSAYMEEFAKRYTKIAGEWNDEAGTKVYALEIILRTLQKAGPKAINDVNEFKKAMRGFVIDNPLLNEKFRFKYVKYVGRKDFGQQRQIGMPLVVNEFGGGQFRTLFLGFIE